MSVSGRDTTRIKQLASEIKTSPIFLGSLENRVKACFEKSPLFARDAISLITTLERIVNIRFSSKQRGLLLAVLDDNRTFLSSNGFHSPEHCISVALITAMLMAEQDKIHPIPDSYKFIGIVCGLGHDARHPGSRYPSMNLKPTMLERYSANILGKIMIKMGFMAHEVSVAEGIIQATAPSLRRGLCDTRLYNEMKLKSYPEFMGEFVKSIPAIANNIQALRIASILADADISISVLSPYWTDFMYVKLLDEIDVENTDSAHLSAQRFFMQDIVCGIFCSDACEELTPLMFETYRYLLPDANFDLAEMTIESKHTSHLTKLKLKKLGDDIKPTDVTNGNLTFISGKETYILLRTGSLCHV